MIGKLRVLELEPSVTGTKKEKNQKRHAIQKQIKTFVVKDEVQKNKLKSIKTFSKSNDISRQKVLQHLKDKNLPKLNDYQCALCDAYITKEEVKHELNKMEITNLLQTIVPQKDSINLFGPVLKFLSFCHLKWLL